MSHRSSTYWSNSTGYRRRWGEPRIEHDAVGKKKEQALQESGIVLLDRRVSGNDTMSHRTRIMSHSSMVNAAWWEKGTVPFYWMAYAQRREGFSMECILPHFTDQRTVDRWEAVDGG